MIIWISIFREFLLEPVIYIIISEFPSVCPHSKVPFPSRSLPNFLKTSTEWLRTSNQTLNLISNQTSNLKPYPDIGYFLIPDTSGYQIFPDTRYSGYRILPDTGYFRIPDTSGYQIFPDTGYFRIPDISRYRIFPDTGTKKINWNKGDQNC